MTKYIFCRMIYHRMNRERYIPLRTAAKQMQLYGYDEEQVEADDIWLMNRMLGHFDEAAAPLSLSAQRFISSVEDSHDLGEELAKLAAEGLLTVLREHQSLITGRISGLLKQRPGLFVLPLGEDMARPTSVVCDESTRWQLIPRVGERALFLQYYAWRADVEHMDDREQHAMFAE